VDKRKELSQFAFTFDFINAFLDEPPAFILLGVLF
jgi:hypothetical protein